MPQTKTSSVLIGGFVFVASLALLQFWRQSSLGGPFRYLGEPVLSFSNPQVATVYIPPLNILNNALFADTYLRSYATFPHPNALAGYLVIGILSVRLLVKRPRLQTTLCVVMALGLLTTFSRSGLLALCASMVIISSLSRFIKILLLFVSAFLLLTIFNITSIGLTDSYLLREGLVVRAINLLVNFPVFGVGLGTFSLNASNFTLMPHNSNYSPQPVHNIFLLVTSETGAIGLLLLIIIMIKILKPLKINTTQPMVFLVTLLITGSLDHYWITSWQNSALLVVLASLFIPIKQHELKYQL